MLLERHKATVSTEPVISGTTAGSTGETPLLTGAPTPVTKRDGLALSTKKTRENVNVQHSPPTPTREGEETAEDQYTNHDNDSNREEEGSDEEEGDSTEEETDSNHHVESECTDSAPPDIKSRTVLSAFFDQIKEKIKTDLENSCDARIAKIYENVFRTEGISPDREEPTSGSPNVTSTSLPPMPATAMDINVRDAVLPAKATVKVPAKLVEKSLGTRRYIHVSRKNQKRPDPNSCKTT